MDFVEIIKDRLRSPILSNFMLSWLVINWEIPYVTFFIDEETLKNQTKIEFIHTLLAKECSWVNLLFLPFCGVIFMVLIYPWFANGADVALMYSKSWIKKYAERNSNSFKTISEVNKDLVKLNELTLNDFKLKILNHKITLEDIFTGKWKVEIFNPHEESFNCVFSGNKFLNDKGTVLFLDNLEPVAQSGNFTGTIRVNFTDQKNESLMYNFSIDSRHKIRLTPQHGHPRAIRLLWTEMNNNF